MVQREVPLLQNKSESACTGDKGKGDRGKQAKKSGTIPNKVSTVPIGGDGFRWRSHGDFLYVDAR